ncbi:LapA family protein [Pelistega suis]|uniref:LapA family protein n=1 Tax=Pelistega suis TaxID=1631957 RepID=A0A849P408_9BURK|nr:LapA family protein [Pelistega suis]NOL52399.1 LapA family protein [Pelistega suis]
MRYIIWALRLIVFVLVVLFAIKNTAGVDINFFGSATLTGIPLIIVILASFMLGAFYMYLLNLPTRFARGREITRLKGEVQHLQTDLQHLQEVKPGTQVVTTVTPPDGFVANK